MTCRTVRNALMGFYGVSFVICAVASVMPPNAWAMVCALIVAANAGLVWHAMSDSE